MKYSSLYLVYALCLVLCLCACRTTKHTTSLEQGSESLYYHSRVWDMQAVRLDTLTATVLRFDTVGRVIERTELVGRSRSSIHTKATDTVYIHQKDSTRLEKKKETASSPAPSLLDTLSHLALGALIGALALGLVTLYKHPKR